MNKGTTIKNEGRLYTRAIVDSATVVENENERSFEVVFATENPVYRRGWEENFNEVLSCVKEHMRTGRLEESAVPLLDNHDRYSGVSGQMGIVTEYRILKNECRAKVLFSTQEKFDGIWKDVKAGIIRSISTGYNVYKYLREVVEGGIPTYRAIDWEAVEISLAPVPADYKSKVRLEGEQHEVEIHEHSPETKMRSDMKIENKNEVVEQPETSAERSEATHSGTTEPIITVDVNNARSEGVQAERARVTAIQSAVRNASLDNSLATDLINRGVDINAAREEIINKLAEGNSSKIRNNSPTIVVDEVENTRLAMADALIHRSQPGSIKLEGKAQDFKYTSMLGMARHCLNMAGEKGDSFSPNEVIKRAISTTDYPNLLNSTVERSIRRTYEALPAEWKNIANQTNAKDFREKTGIAVDGKVTFEEIAEGGEYKHAALITDDSAKIKLKTYGRMIKITRQAIINDDLDVFSKLPKLLAQGAANFQADAVWGLILNNAKTPDNKAIFHADHGNLTSVGTAISEGSLNVARTQMYKHKTPAGELMPIVPKYLIVPIELVMTAEKILSSVLASAGMDINTMKGRFEILTNPRLTNATNWYMAAEPSNHEGLVYAYLEGEEGLFIEKEVSFADDSVSTKARLDFAAAAWDYRGWYKNVGA